MVQGQTLERALAVSVPRKNRAPPEPAGGCKVITELIRMDLTTDLRERPYIRCGTPGRTLQRSRMPPLAEVDGRQPCGKAFS